MQYKNKAENHNFWLKRISSNSPDKICTNDPYLDIFESNYILSKVRKNISILEVGCGNGLLYEKIRNKVNIKKYLGTDFISELVALANAKIKNPKDLFLELDMAEINQGSFNQKFDLIISKRAIQNILSTKIQLKVIDNLGYFLKENGSMILLESSKIAQNNINLQRKLYNLQKIDPPFHNLFLNDIKLNEYNFKNINLIKIDPFSSDFYFITRVLYARYASEYLNEAPTIDHPLSKIALSMRAKQITNQFSQIQAYIFTKKKNIQ